VSKRESKFHKNEDYSDDYKTTKSRGDKDKKRSKYQEFERVLSDEQHEFQEKFKIKNGYYDLDY